MVFGGEPNLAASFASLSVLFEDLRIEISGMAAPEIESMDECGKNLRTLYFTRRSIATLHEFTKVLVDLDASPSFALVKAKFAAIPARHWKKAILYLSQHDRYTARVRNNVGGHFGRKSGELAIQNFVPDAEGKIEVSLYDSGGGAKLHFANEIAATTALRQIPGTTSVERARRLTRRAIIGYRHAIRAVDCLVYYCFWDRFGL